MNADEQAIRDIVATWHRATAAGDVDAVVPLMTGDVVFLTPGNPPMQGRAKFEASLRSLLLTHRVESSWNIEEIQTSGDMAYCWSLLEVRITPLVGGDTVLRTGSALSILRKQASGRWQIVRDANLLSLAK
ncbi:MAG TPA: SgcJ/EcaC family oxidoreductase [Methylibium sp.]